MSLFWHGILSLFAWVVIMFVVSHRPPPVSINGFDMVPEDFDYSGTFGLASSR